MIPWIGAAFLVVGFVILVQLFGLVERSTEVVALTRQSLEVIRDAGVSDDVKETTLQKNAIWLLRSFFVLSFAGAAAVFLPVGVLWVGKLLGWISLESIFHMALSPWFIAVSSIFAILALFWSARKKPEAPNYSRLDRLLHDVAFKTRIAQIGMADIEDKLFAKQLSACKVDRPVFVTAIPRAGTTLLLECCSRVPEFASHCYRDMPFLLVPCLWSRFSAAFRKTGELRPRAHGDGMLIDFDSPEAFEEMLWKVFWPQHYTSNRILPWKDESNDEFHEFFRNHMRKIIFLRRGENAPKARYLSKNNPNIARVGILRRLFPDSIILIPFRQPVQHAASLLQQHRNFLRIHEEDRFASKYMRAIGHHDFGKNLLPIDFDGWYDRRESQDPESLAFWLEYWVVGYKHLLQREADSLNFLCYEQWCKSPEHGTRLLAEVLGSRDPDPLLATAATVRAPRARDVDTGEVSASLLREADSIYTSLKDIALN